MSNHALFALRSRRRERPSPCGSSRSRRGARRSSGFWDADIDFGNPSPPPLQERLGAPGRLFLSAAAPMRASTSLAGS